MPTTLPVSRLSPPRSIQASPSHWRWVQPSPASRLPADKVELSPHARWMSQLAQLPSVRMDRVEQVRAQIAAGNYETDERLDTAIDRLAEDLSALD